jgi:hypothetical protein
VWNLWSAFPSRSREALPVIRHAAFATGQCTCHGRAASACPVQKSAYEGHEKVQNSAFESVT